MNDRKRVAARFATAGVAIAALCGAAVLPAAAASLPPGAAKPTPGSGIGTAAALDNPKCAHDDPSYGVYGRFNSTFVGGGAVCVKPWKAGANNGGATAPINRAGNTRGNYQDAVHDTLLPMMKYYETWGRDIEMRILVSTGNDEATQRADAGAIKAEKPFAVVNFVPAGLDFLDAEIPKAKILVFGYATTAKKALAQAPYR